MGILDILLGYLNILLGYLNILLITIISGASVVFVIMPIVNRNDSGEEPIELDLDRITLEEEKEEAYNALKEAEFDYETGKLSDKDYGIIKEKYSKIAVEAMQKIEKHEKQPSKKDGVVGVAQEDTAKCANCGKTLPNGAKFCQSCGNKVKPQAQVKKKANNCHSCGSEYKKEDKFCPSCGNKVRPQANANICSKCGTEHKKNDKFCQGCGQRLT